MLVTVECTTQRIIYDQPRMYQSATCLRSNIPCYAQYAHETRTVHKFFLLSYHRSEIISQQEILFEIDFRKIRLNAVTGTREDILMPLIEIVLKCGAGEGWRRSVGPIV